MANNGRVTIDVDINGHIKGFEQAVSKANQELQKLRIDDKATKGAKEMFKTLQSELTRYEQLSQDALSGKNVASALNKSKNTIISTLKSIGREYQSLGKGDIGFSEEVKKLQSQLDVLKSGFGDIGNEVADKFANRIYEPLDKLDGKMKASRTHVDDFMAALRTGDPTKVAEEFQKLQQYYDRFGSKNEYVRQSFEACKESSENFNTTMSSTIQEMDKLDNEIKTLTDQDFASLQSILEKLGIDFNDFTRWINENTDANIRLGQATRESEREFSNLENRIKHFFSLTNGFMLFRRAVQGAFNTVKELDAVMTETAVVTDFSVSDMWDKLPEYTKMANELGATTKGAYETATLYYQQGLKTNEVMAVSAETMKMARIAGLDYATATDYMTAALRGFNMEITTDSAERVNDVYSRLAAVTASNTQEISVAMTKVASLAHNANMEFETTAAFLAQIIETTRESAETAGTALKTVVARFTEVKKLYNEGELLGTDEEGEEIDVNKVSTALRSAGIDMNKYFTGQVGLDDIFMELASKWDSLDKVQQRYIATMAAGSRQQSRFIAMMSNYQRTLELVGEAENSAGAGQKQFEKTMESLEAKLNKLKNAWDSFLMGLANSDLIKSAVDWLTELITKLNDFINGISNGNGVFKTFVTLMTTLAGMKLGKALLTGTTGLLSGLMGIGNRKQGNNFKDIFSPRQGQGWLFGNGENIGLGASVIENASIGIMGIGNKFSMAAGKVNLFTKAMTEGGIKTALSTSQMGTAFGGLLTTLKASAVAAGQFLLAIAPYAIALGAVALAIYAVVKAIKDYNNRFEIMHENAQKMRDDAQATRDAIDENRNLVSSISDKQDSLDNMIKGTKEWKDAVADLNSEIQNLIDLDPEAANFVTVQNGVFVLDEEGYKKVLASKEAKTYNQEKVSYAKDTETYEAEAENVLNTKIQGKSREWKYRTNPVEGSVGYGVDVKRNLSKDEVERLYEDVMSGALTQAMVNATNETGKTEYEEYLKNNFGLNSLDIDWATLFANASEYAEAKNNAQTSRDTYAQQFGLTSISEAEYDAKIATKTKEFEKLTGEELVKQAEQLGVDWTAAMDQILDIHKWDPDYIFDFKDLSFRTLLAQDLAEATAFNFEELHPEMSSAYINNQTGMNDLQKQQFSFNLNTMESAGIQLNSDLLAQAAEYTKSGKDIQELIDSLIKLMDIENSHAKNVEALRKTNENAGFGLSEEEIEAQTKAWEKDEKEIKELQKVLSDTPEDYEAIQEAAEKAFDSKVTKDFIEQNIDEFEKLAAGGEDAVDAFNRLAERLAVNNVNDALIEMGKNALDLGGIIDQINAMEISVGGSADLTPIYDSLVQMLEDAGVATEQATKIAEGFLTSLNYELTWADDGYDYITVPEIKAGVKGDKYTVTESTGKEGGGVRIPVQRKRLIASKTGPSPLKSAGLGGSGGSGGSGGGGGGGSNSNPDRWLNPYDKFYNLTEQINEALRQREKLERNYDRILKNRWSLQKDIQGNTQARLASLKQEIEMNKRLLAGRQEQLDAVLNEKFLDDDKNIRAFRDFGVAKYANYNTARGTVEIDWEGLERLSGTTDTQLGGVIENFVKRLEELQDQWEDTDKVIEDLEDEVQEILDINKEEYLSFEQRVFDAIVDREQKLIDGYSDLSETISNDNEEVLNALSESIDLSRQIRDNTKTEEEIAEKEARLAYLRRDTSGANDLAIKQLEKELEQARESYGDTLIDQELDRLSQANEDAAKQRERQIEIMQAQLDWQQKVGFFWNEVINLLQNNYGQTDEGMAKELVDLLEATDAFSGMSEFQKADWLQKLHTEWLESESGHASWRLSEAKAASMGESGKESNYSIGADQTTAGKALRYDYDRDMWLDEDEGWYTGVSYNAESNLFDYTGYSSKASRDAEAAAQAAKAQAEATKRSSVGVGSYINASGAPIYTSAYGGSPLTQYFGNDPKYLVLDDYGSSWMVRWHGLSSGITGFFRKGDVRGYKTGGLVNTTGPAWLDGTPQRPEFVLNADQTQAFMKLVDKLGNGTGAGDNYFDVNIVVDQISSDYDVDRLVDRIKQKITEDAQYRNVNAINWIR